MLTGTHSEVEELYKSRQRAYQPKMLRLIPVEVDAFGAFGEHAAVFFTKLGRHASCRPSTFYVIMIHAS
jgi:hypothetical protein